MYLNNICWLIIDEKVPWLTLTWDVFKSPLIRFLLICYIRLTLTWDVFKFKLTSSKWIGILRLTLTWDVFK